MGHIGHKIGEENQGPGGKGTRRSHSMREERGWNQQRQILLENTIMKPNIMHDRLKMAS